MGMIIAMPSINSSFTVCIPNCNPPRSHRSRYMFVLCIRHTICTKLKTSIMIINIYIHILVSNKGDSLRKWRFKASGDDNDNNQTNDKMKQQFENDQAQD